MATKSRRNSEDALNELEELEGVQEFDELKELEAVRAEEAAALAQENEDDDTLLEDELEEYRLTGRQKLIVAATATVSFFIFSLVFFPLEGLIRYQLQQYEKLISLDFASLDLNFFGSDTIDGLRGNVPNAGIGFSAERTESELKWRDLISSQLDGPVRLQNVDFHMEGLAFEAATLELFTRIPNLQSPLATWNGRVQIRGGGMQITELPLASLPMPVNIDQLRVQKLDLIMKFANGTVDFEDTVLISDLFTARLTGTGRLGGNLGATGLHAKLCLRPGADLENKNPELFTLYIMGGGAAGGELCADIAGSIASPQVNIQRSAFPGAPDSMNATEPGDSSIGEPAPENNDSLNADNPADDSTEEPGDTDV